MMSSAAAIVISTCRANSAFSDGYSARSSSLAGALVAGCSTTGTSSSTAAAHSASKRGSDSRPLGRLDGSIALRMPSSRTVRRSSSAAASASARCRVACPDRRRAGSPTDSATVSLSSRTQRAPSAAGSSCPCRSSQGATTWSATSCSANQPLRSVVSSITPPTGRSRFWPGKVTKYWSSVTSASTPNGRVRTTSSRKARGTAWPWTSTAPPAPVPSVTGVSFLFLFLAGLLPRGDLAVDDHHRLAGGRVAHVGVQVQRDAADLLRGQQAVAERAGHVKAEQPQVAEADQRRDGDRALQPQLQDRVDPLAHPHVLDAEFGEGLQARRDPRSRVPRLAEDPGPDGECLLAARIEVGWLCVGHCFLSGVFS